MEMLKNITTAELLLELENRMSLNKDQLSNLFHNALEELQDDALHIQNKIKEIESLEQSFRQKIEIIAEKYRIPLKLEINEEHVLYIPKTFKRDLISQEFFTSCYDFLPVGVGWFYHK